MKKKFVLLSAVYLAAMSLTGCFYDVEADLYPETDCSAVTPGFASHVSALIATQCAGCHSGAAPDAGLSLETYTDIRDAALSGAIEDRISRASGDPMLMPPNGALGTCDIEAFITWVADGAPEN
jgi:mono/diheme cytochrome c family protein